MTRLTLAQVDDAIRQLPALATVVMEVLRAIDEGNTEMMVLDRLIGHDQGLATRILRVANSPFYGLSGQIDSIRDACVLLGVHTLRHLTLAAGVIDQFPPSRGGSFDRLNLWRHAVGVGITARVLAPYSRQDPDQAFTAGLLHDIGKLALDVCFPKQFAEALRYRDSADCTLLAAETAVLGIDHSMVGARLGNRWRLPSVICVAVGRHHSPDLESAIPLADLVHIADLVCRGLEMGDGGDSQMPPMSTQAMERLGLSWNDIAGALPEIEKLNATSTLLG